MDIDQNKYYEKLDKITEKYNIEINEGIVSFKLNNIKYSVLDFSESENIFLIPVFYSFSDNLFKLLDEMCDIDKELFDKKGNSIESDEKIKYAKKHLIKENMYKMVATFTTIFRNTVITPNNINSEMQFNFHLLNYMKTISEDMHIEELLGFWKDYLFIVEFAIKTGNKKIKDKINKIIDSIPENKPIKMRMLNENNEFIDIELKNKNELLEYFDDFSKMITNLIFNDEQEIDLNTIDCINTKPC